MGLPDPAASRAVLFGVDRYPGITDLPAVANNLTRLTALLTDPGVWGLSPAHCTVLSNPQSRDQVIDAVYTAADQAADALFVYFAGHGLLDEQTSELLLAMPETSDLVYHNAVRYDDIRKIISRSRGITSKIVMLDCCFSGTALEGFMGPATGITDRSQIDGTYLITASAETAAASAPLGETYTAFTGEVIRALENGVPGGPDLLDMDTLYWHVRQELEVKGRPLPQQRARNSGGTIILGRNRNGRNSPTEVQQSQDRPEMPADARSVMMLEPREFFAVVAVADPPRAEALLMAAGAHRPDQEVAGLVLYAHRAGLGRGTAGLLAGAGFRSADEIWSITEELRHVDLADAVAILLRNSAARSVRLVAELAAVLHEHGRAAALRDLLKYAAESWGTPDSMVGLVGALSLPVLRPAADAMLVAKARQTPPLDAIMIADVLLAGGRDEAAFCFYERALTLVVNRPEPEIASLASAMNAAGATGPAERLSAAAFANLDSPGAVAALSAAMWDVQMGSLVDAALDRIAVTWTLTDLVILGRLLRRSGQDDAELRMFAAAAIQGGADTTTQLMAALEDAGVPRSARRLLDQAVTSLVTEQLVTLIMNLIASQTHSGVRHLIELLVGEHKQRITEIDPGSCKALAEGYSASVSHDMPRVIALTGRITESNPMASALYQVIAEHAEDSLIVQLAESFEGDDWHLLTLVYLAAGTFRQPETLKRITNRVRSENGRDWLRSIVTVAQTTPSVSLSDVLNSLHHAGFSTEVADVFSTAGPSEREWLIDTSAALDPSAARAIFDAQIAAERIDTVATVVDGLAQRQRPDHVRELLDSFFDHRDDVAAANILAQALTNKGNPEAAQYLHQRIQATKTQHPETAAEKRGWRLRRH